MQHRPLRKKRLHVALHHPSDKAVVVWNPGGFCNAKNNFTIDLPPHKTSENVNDQLLQILLVSRKKPRTQPKFHDDAPLSHLRDPHLLALTFSGLLFVLFVLLLILLLVAAFLVACVPVAACCCRCFCCCLCLLLLWGPPTVEPTLPSPPLQCLTFQNVNNNFHNGLDPSDLNQLRHNLPVSHRISTGKRSSPPPPPPPPPPFGAPHLLASIFLGLPLPVVVWKTHPCHFDLPKMCAVLLLLFVLFLPFLLLLDAGFSCCVLFFLLFVLLLLPLLRFTVVNGLLLLPVVATVFAAALPLVAAAFGQIWFGQYHIWPKLTGRIWPIFCFGVGWSGSGGGGPEGVGGPKGRGGPKGWGAKGWGPEPRKSGAPKGGRRVGAPKGGAPKGGGPKISRFFFPSPAAKFVLFFHILLVVSLTFGGVWSAGALKCARLEFSGCRVKPWRPRNKSGQKNQKHGKTIFLKQPSWKFGQNTKTLKLVMCGFGQMRFGRVRAWPLPLPLKNPTHPCNFWPNVCIASPVVCAAFAIVFAVFDSVCAASAAVFHVCAAAVAAFAAGWVLLFVQLASACAACSFSDVLAAFSFLLVLLFLFCVLLLLLCATVFCNTVLLFFCCLSCFCCRFWVTVRCFYPRLPLLTFQDVCTAFVAFCAVFAIFAAAWCWLFLLCAVFLVVRVAFADAFAVYCCLWRCFRCSCFLFSCCCFCCFCCFVAAAAVGAFKSPTVEKPIFARFWPPKMFLLLVLLFVLLCCCSVLLVLLFVQLAAACAACCLCFSCCCCCFFLFLLVSTYHTHILNPVDPASRHMLVTELLRALSCQTLRTLDHSPNAFALAQGCAWKVHTRAHAVTHALSISR